MPYPTDYRTPREGITLPDGQVIRAERLSYGGYYDRDQLASSVTAGFQTQYFLRANAVTSRLETNVTTAGRIGTGYFEVQSLGVHVYEPGSTPVTASDLGMIINGSLVRFLKDGQELFELPCFMFQAGVGISGQTTATGTSLVTNGVPSKGLVPSLPFSIDLFDTSTFEVDITYPAALTLSTATIFVEVILEGIRAVVLSG